MPALPTTDHVYRNHHLDSTRWKYFTPRDDDIIVATSYKAGTTLTQTIVGNLLFPDGNLPGPASFISPWLDMRIFPLELVLGQLEEQQHRRYIKTHVPLDGLPFYRNSKYICVSRDPRDVFVSLLHHWESNTDEFVMALNNTPGLVGEEFPKYSNDIKRIWSEWITKSLHPWESGGYPFWSHLSYALTFWKYRHLPNIKMLHFNDLLADLEGQMRDLADYLEIDVAESAWPDVVRRCTFAEVKKDPSRVVGENIAFAFKGGADAFIHKGTNGRWIDILDDDDLALYDKAIARLPADYASWLETGGRTK